MENGAECPPLVRRDALHVAASGTLLTAARHALTLRDTTVVSAAEPTPYEQFGGAPFFAALVADFYGRVATDPVLSAMYPGADLGPAEERLRMFLEQYWSGPDTYSERRGPPRLRMRHAPFAIDEDAHDRWLKHMRAALDEQRLAPELDAALWTYLVNAAAHMRNA